MSGIILFTHGTEKITSTVTSISEERKY